MTPKVTIKIEFYDDVKKYWMSRDDTTQDEYGPYTYLEMIEILRVIDSEINTNK